MDTDGYVEDGREISDDDLDEETIQKEQKNKMQERSSTLKVTERPQEETSSKC